MKKIRVIFFWLLVLLTSLLTFSYTGLAGPNPAPQRPETDEMAEIRPRIQLVRQLMSARDYQSAADILEVLYEKYPQNTTISNSLKSCYEYLKQYAKGEMLLRDLIKQFPKSTNYKLNLAENLIFQGKMTEGRTIYKELIDDFDPANPLGFSNIVRSMIMAGLEDDALEIIDNLRIQAADTKFLALERANILEGRRKYTEASKEYISMLSDSTRARNIAEKKLSELLEFPESNSSAEKVLLDNIDSDSSGHVLKILSTYFLKTGNYNDAFEFAVRQDSATGFSGVTLMEFMRGCMERQLYGQAIRMSEYVISNFKDKPIISETYYRYAEALEGTGHYNEAIAIYDTILAVFPQRRDKAEACYRIGRIYMERLDNPQFALKFFDSVKARYPSGFGYNNAVMAIPHAYLQMGDLKNSRREFAEISKKRASGETVEEADYYLALIDFFEHNYDSAAVELKKLMVNFPKGFLVNDAIQLSFTIDQAEGAQDLLDDFAGALLYQEMKLYDSTVLRLFGIADAENQALADIALFRIIEIYVERGDSTGAIKTVERLENEHPESYYLPFGLKIKADIFLSKEGNTATAKEIYFKLLENYQNYPFINEVREKMRILESSAKPS